MVAAFLFAVTVNTGLGLQSDVAGAAGADPLTLSKIDKLINSEPTRPTFPDRSQQAKDAEAYDAQQAAAAAEAARQAELAQEAQQVAYQAAVSISGDCSSWMVAAGISDVAHASLLINRESGCNPNAVNRSSGACGIGQQLPCGKWAHTWNDPVGGLIDMQNYVYAVYGSWANAWAHEQDGWY